MFSFNLVICFCPGKLGAKPDALTRQWDVYPKEGDSGYAWVNPQNLQPVFTQEQLANSLQATYLEFLVLRAVAIMGIETLHSNILTALPSDPIAQAHVSDTAKSRWSVNESSFLWLDRHIYIPDIEDLHLRVLWNKHDHPISGHYAQNQIMDLIRHEYTWPGIRTMVKDYIQSCTTCAQSKAPCHHPYGLLKQLPIPEKPWNSILMDFIEQLPLSSGSTAILVVVDRLSKQSIFILTHDTITSPSLQSSSYSMCSLSTVYWPMSHPTGVLSLCPTSSGHSERLPTCAFTSPPVIILRVMARPSVPTRHSNSTSGVIAIISRTTGPNYYP